MIRKSPALIFLIYGFAAIWLIMAAFPFVFTLLGSFKAELDFFGSDWRNVLTGKYTIEREGGYFTGIGYRLAWIQEGFWKAAINTMVVTICTVAISLTFGTLGGYALARSTYHYAFWILMIALVFRAMPHVTLVAGYKAPLFEYGLWGYTWVSIVVLVAINQPFTIWMMRSFFMNIPNELDESALIDGCNRLQGFWYVIMPVMWPGVITTGLFSFLLAYNDFTVTSALLSEQSATMVPTINSYLGTAQQDGIQMAAVAAVVSATAPLFVLIMVFQRQLVSGLTAGAVKG